MNKPVIGITLDEGITHPIQYFHGMQPEKIMQTLSQN